MRKDYEKLFKHLVSPEPPAGLFDRVLNRIGEEQRLRALRRRIALLFVGFLGSLAVSVPILEGLQRDFSQSGFFQFLSLLFSDTSVAVVYWQDYALSLLESLPAASMLALFATLFVLVGSLKFLVRDVKMLTTSS